MQTVRTLVLLVLCTSSVEAKAGGMRITCAPAEQPGARPPYAVTINDDDAGIMFVPASFCVTGNKRSPKDLNCWRGNVSRSTIEDIVVFAAPPDDKFKGFVLGVPVKSTGNIAQGALALGSAEITAQNSIKVACIGTEY